MDTGTHRGDTTPGAAAGKTRLPSPTARSLLSCRSSSPKSAPWEHFLCRLQEGLTSQPCHGLGGAGSCNFLCTAGRGASPPEPPLAPGLGTLQPRLMLLQVPRGTHSTSHNQSPPSVTPRGSGGWAELSWATSQCPFSSKDV